MEFEFDEKKSETNRAKHGIDFVAAQALWLDEMHVEIPARTEDEPRSIVIGMIADKHWSAVIAGQGRWIVTTSLGGRPWTVVVEPDFDDRVIFVVTAYEREIAR